MTVAGGSNPAAFLRVVKYGTETINAHASARHNYDNDGDEFWGSSSDELDRSDSDTSLWYTSGYTALANFFLKPKLRLVAVPPYEYQAANVKWFNKDGKWEDLGPKKVFFTYLNIENNGRANAKDCAILFTTPEGHGPFVFAQELPLIYTSIVGHGFEIKAGMRVPYEILADGKPIPTESSQTIAQRGGKSTILLLFVVEGFKQSIVALAKGTAGLPMEPRTIKLRTSVDGKLHQVKLDPAPNGSYVAEILG